MKYLTIIRHAKSSWDDPKQSDMVRPLNERGKQAIPIMGKFLRSKEIRPDLVICSPATRALETATALSPFFHYPVEKLEINKDIYFGDATALVKMISGLKDDFNDVFIFGHEPILSSLIYRLSGEALIKFSTCAVYRMSFGIKKWTDISAQKGKCEFFVYPKLLQME